MYVLIHKNRVLVGPRDWNRAMFDDALSRLQIQKTLSVAQPDNLPIVIDEDTKICEAQVTYQPFNEKIEYLHGPFWNFDTDIAQGTFEKLETPIELIKNTLTVKAAEVRWKKEIAGTTATVQGTVVTVDTNRDSRNIFVQQYLLMGDTDTVNWKFPERWATLTKSDLGIIVNAGAVHIRTAFDWELERITAIAACTTAQELDAIVLEEPVVQPNFPQL
jgi:hypothetical protein